MSNLKDIDYIKDVIIAEFGYDKELYISKSYDKSYFTPSHEFALYSQKLSVETFKRHIDNNESIVLYKSSVYYYKGDEHIDEEFVIDLYLGYPKTECIDDLSNNCNAYGLLYGINTQFYNSITVTINLLPGYKELLRTRQIDKLLE